MKEKIREKRERKGEKDERRENTRKDGKGRVRETYEKKREGK